MNLPFPEARERLMNRIKAIFTLIKSLPKRYRTPAQLARLFYIIQTIRNAFKKEEKKDVK